MQRYSPNIAWPRVGDPWPIMAEDSQEGDYYHREDVERLLSLLTRARNGFVGHLCTDGKPHGVEQDPSITCLRCEIDSVLQPKTD